MKSILESVHGQISLTEKQLEQIVTYLFNDGYNLPALNDDDLVDTLEVLKDIVTEHSFITVHDLQEYYTRKKEKYRHFIQSVIDKTSSDGEINETEFVALSNLHIPVQGSLFLYTIMDISNELEIATFRKPFNEYLEFLSLKFIQLLAGGLRNEFAHLKEHTVDISCFYTHKHFIIADVECIFEKRKLIRYFEKFSNNDDSQKLIFWESTPENEPGILSTMFLVDKLEGKFSNTCNNVRMITSHWDTDHIISLYDNILDYIQREKPISDKKVKYEIINWLLFSKLYSSDKRSSEMYEDQENVNSLMDISCNGEIPEYLPLWNKRAFAKSRALYRATLAMKKWTILKSPPGYAWITSDNPGFGINLLDLEPEFGNLTLDANLDDIRTDTLIYYPLSSEYCLRIMPDTIERTEYHHADTIEFEESSLNEWKLVNGLTFSTKKEVVMGNDKRLLEKLEIH
jgi:hypothetical protein